MEDAAKLPVLTGQAGGLARSEAAMLAKVRAGDERLAQAIYEEEAPRLLRRLRFLACDPAVAEEILQETFVVAFTSRRAFGGRSKLATWLYGIAFNHLRRHHEKKARRSNLDRLVPAPVEGDASAAERLVDEREALRRLDAALRQLDLRKREAFVLRIVEGRSLEEAASLVGASPATLSYRARTAEELVRKYLEQTEKSDDV